MRTFQRRQRAFVAFAKEGCWHWVGRSDDSSEASCLTFNPAMSRIQFQCVAHTGYSPLTFPHKLHVNLRMRFNLKNIFFLHLIAHTTTLFRLVISTICLVAQEPLFFVMKGKGETLIKYPNTPNSGLFKGLLTFRKQTTAWTTPSSNPGRSTQPPVWALLTVSSITKRPRRVADHLSSSNAQVTNEWIYTSTIPMTS
jgi:hypothetical protein